MRSSRARFKYALRQCKLDERLIVSEKLADHMKNHEINDFWKDIRKHSKSKSALSNCIDGVTGENAIADLWRDHYESLLNIIMMKRQMFCKVLTIYAHMQGCM